MLELQNLTVGYKDRPVVQGVNLAFRPGEITTIIGKNGTGKSTLLKTACSLLKPQSGTILLEGKNQQQYSRKEWAKKIAFLSQHHTDSSSTLYTLVSHGRYPHLGFSQRMNAKDLLLVEKALRTMGLEDLEEKSVSAISGGERQKAYLAMVLAQDTPYIALDEPATYLDLALQKQILRLLKSLKDQDKCMIAVMHDLGSALEISDYICLLDKGEVVAYTKPEALLTSGLIESVFGVTCTQVSTKKGPRYLFS